MLASAARPAPLGPSTPKAWASSTSRRAPLSSQISAIWRNGAMSPSIEYTVSTATSAPPAPCCRARMRRSRLSTELWRKKAVVPDAILAPSARLAWQDESRKIWSSGPTSVDSTPRLTA